MSSKKRLIVCIIAFSIPFMTACMQTVTRYKEERVPIEVTKYRTVQKPVEQQVEVPYQEEVRTPEYKTIRNPRINVPEGHKMTLAFLPFTSSTGNMEDGSEISERIRQAVIRHPDAPNRFSILSPSQIRDTLGNGSLKVTPEAIQKLRNSLGAETIITGHVNSIEPSLLSFRVEAIAARAVRLLFGADIAGDRLKAIQQALELFYGLKVQQSIRTEIISKTRIETKVVYESVQEPYIVTEYEVRQVPYQVEEVDLLATLLLGLLASALGLI